ncbi:MAG: 23S rRNA (pseudouridine(1915)-N(3))-methyltransferase RlmH [gamma proteobacterium symbiont of Phacoides pectinatus]
MHIHLICIGTKMPHWVQEGYREYAKRLPAECTLRLVEIAPGHRGKGADLRRAMQDEGERMLKAIPNNCRVIALDIPGKAWSTEQLASHMDGWMNSGQDLALLVGGPEGLAPGCLERTGQRWSLSPLTLPHPLVRVVLAEQIYRAWSLLRNHPYHRA